MKRNISLILAILIIFSVFSISSVSAEDTSKPFASLPEVKEGCNRYFFLLPDDWFWDESNVVGIYWEEGTDACEKWPGYEAHKADIEDVYYYDVPEDVESVIWNNHYINSEIDYNLTRYNKRTDWLSLKTPQGNKIPSGMIAVPDPDWEEDKANGKFYPPCDWYCYYGDGKYGTDHTDEEDNTYRYYFYLPEEWDTENAVATVYWWYPISAEAPVSAEKTNIEGLYYCDIPAKVTDIYFGNSTDFSFDGEGKFLHIDCKYKRGKVFVVDLDKSIPDVNYTDRMNYFGDWYSYYGDGTFGISETKGEKVYSCRSFGGDNPAPVVETNRYYFYMPENWENILSDGARIYWWEGTNNCGGFWPGYNAHYDNVSGLYYYDVPKDVTTIIWSNGVTDHDGVPSGVAFRTANLNTEYYEAGENKLYPDGLKSFDNMVYVIDYNETSFTLEGQVFGGNWYYYYGNGEYGTTPEKGDTVYSERHFGKTSKYNYTSPAKGEIALFFMDYEVYNPYKIIYTVTKDGKDEIASEYFTPIARSESSTLYYVNVPEEDIKDVYIYCCDSEKSTHYIKKNVVNNVLFRLGTFVNDKYDYRTTLMTDSLQEIEVISGDADLNGRVTIQDATTIQKLLGKKLQLPGYAKAAADFNGDGKVTIQDATTIQKHLAGLA